MLKVVRGINSFSYSSIETVFSLTGQDATDAFEDVGHSDEARALLPTMLVGDFEKDGVSNHAIFITIAIVIPFHFRPSS